jgi:hypothetical protein
MKHRFEVSRKGGGMLLLIGGLIGAFAADGQACSSPARYVDNYNGTVCGRAKDPDLPNTAYVWTLHDGEASVLELYSVNPPPLKETRSCMPKLDSRSTETSAARLAYKDEPVRCRTPRLLSRKGSSPESWFPRSWHSTRNVLPLEMRE